MKNKLLFRMGIILLNASNFNKDYKTWSQYWILFIYKCKHKKHLNNTNHATFYYKI